MEQGRLVIAIALSFLVLIAWNYFFVEPPPVQREAPKPVEKAQTDTVDQKQQPYTPAHPQPAQIQPAEPVTAVAVEKVRTIDVQTPLIHAKITEQGALFKSLVLKDYREEASTDSAPKELIAPDNPIGNLLLGTASEGIVGLPQAVFAAATESQSIEVNDDPQTIVFTWQSAQGVVVEKAYTFSPDSYLIDLEITVKNGSTAPITDRLALSLLKYEAKDSGTTYGFQGPSAYVNDNLEQFKKKKFEEKSGMSGNVKWVAIQDRYFMSGILPVESENRSIYLAAREDGLTENRLLTPPITFNPATQQTLKYQLYFGPKSYKILKSYNNGLGKAVNFGMFDFLAKPCLWLMNFIYANLIPNYGIAIILLTILTKIILWPLGTKSYQSMGKMKKLQPLMTEIREKYKDDKKKTNEELMGLYRTYKVNPMGGCLPMLLQIPVFFALYRMLYEAIELRHAPFFGWINDLSAPDRLFEFGFSVPFMQPPYGIPVLTIVMGATMFLQQKMSPPMGDPTQAKMMMLMPIIFTVIFINFSSGLVLYWLINNILSIGQQYYIQQKNA